MSNRGTVLIVEDQENERRMLTQVLKCEGFHVHSTPDPDGARRYLTDEIDVVLTDMHLGQHTGIDLIEIWKSHNKPTRFIFITGDREPQTAVEAMKRGAFDYLSKPVDPDKLIDVIGRALAEEAA